MKHRVPFGVRSSYLAVAVLALSVPSVSSGQTLGTFSWQLQPFCNVLVFTVTLDGAAIRLSGYDDRCGAATRVPAAGSVTLNANGTYSLSFYEVTPNGLASHTIATLGGSISGPWTDSAGNSGTFAFGIAGPAAGAPRPAPTISSFAIADASITMAKIAAGAVDSARIADGAVTTADLAASSVTLAKIAAGAIDSARIVDGAVTTADLADNSVTAAKLAFPLVDTIGSSSTAMSFTNVGGVLKATTSTGIALWGISELISGAGVIGDNFTGEAVVGRSSGGVGIGAVVGRNSGAGPGVRGFTTGSGIGVLGQVGLAGGTGVAAQFENVNAANASDVLVLSGAGAGDLIQASQSGNARFRVTSGGNVQADGSYTTPAADLAEFIDASDALEPGDVVAIDRAHAGRFRLADEPASTAVAGVITTEPGVLLAARDGRETPADAPALALAGRVPVKVSAENGAIRPGDLLVSSSVPGHAMKAPASPAPGTVIGKALGTLDAGTGVIEMLVMLR